MNPNALIKLGTNALAKTGTSALSNIVRDAATKALTKGFTGAGISTLAKGAGSTLDGLLGRSSGLVLPNATKPATISLAEQYADTPLVKTAQQELAEVADRNNKLITDLASDEDNMWFSDRELKDTRVGDLYPGNAKNRIGSNPDTIIPAEKADIAKMIKDGKLRVSDNDLSYGAMNNYELTDKPLSFEEKNSLLEAIKDALPEEDAEGLALEAENSINPNQLRLIDQNTTPKETKIEITQPRTRKKNIDVALGNKEAKLEKPVSTLGVEDAVAETNTPIAGFTPNVIEPKTATGGAGKGNGGGTPTATASPDFGGLGDSGFNIHLKEGKNIDIELKEPMSKAQIKRNRAIRNLDDGWAKGLNATKKQYSDVVAKSKSAYKGYKTPAEMARRNGISLDNISETPQAVVNAFENRKLNIEKYADERGVNVRLDNLDLTNIEPATKATMKMQGIDPDKIKYTGVASPLEAETLYKDLRNRAMKTTDGDRAVAYNTMADYVRNQIDNTMDNLNIDFSAEMSEALGEALGKEADRQYLRDIKTNKNLKFSDLRREQADWIKVGNLSGNPMKKEPTINIFGIDTGATNPFSAGAEKIKEKIYEKQAYGGGGGSGAENTINFSSAGGERSGTLGNLLGRAKGTGLVGAGLLGGLLLGGGGSGGEAGDLSAMSYGSGMSETAEPEIDPYQTLTIGGYTYDQLEAGYTAALMAGDSAAAKLIANMMGMLDDKAKRYQDAKENSSSGVAGKQRAALNVLSSLMGNYQAQGPIGGRFTQLMNALTGGGYAPGIAAYDSGAQGSLGIVIKALHDTGALSEGDQKRALELLPKTTDSEQAAKMKYQQLIQILQGAGAQ